MLCPDYKDFRRLARDSTLIPVVKSVTADLQTPVSAFLAVAGKEARAFLLESVEGGRRSAATPSLGLVLTWWLRRVTGKSQ